MATVKDFPDFSDWMGGLDERLHSVPLSSIAIPGSHDSFAYYLDTKGPLAPDNPSVLNDLCKVFGIACKDIIKRWSLTQNLNLTEQLQLGIRYFDLRTASKPGTEEPYLVHGLYSNTVESCMKEINNFLDAHPKEIVLLDFNHFYNLNEFAHKQLLSMLLEIFGSKMCPLIDTESVNLSMLWENNLQVLIFYHSDIIKDAYLQFWPGRYIPSPWPDCHSVSNQIAFLEKEYVAGRPKDTFYVHQGVLTPTTKFIMGHLMWSLKDSLAKEIGVAYVNWVAGKKPGLQGINICLLDVVEMADYAATVINLNKKW